MKDYRQTRSRMQRVEDQKNTRQAILFVFLTLVVIVLIIVFGIPGLIKLAIFVGDIKSSKSMVDEQKGMVIVQSPRLNIPYTATTSGKIDIHGSTMSDAKVKLSVNGRPYTVASNLEGVFVFKNVLLDEGSNKLFAVTVKNDQESNPSETHTVAFDNKAPELSIESPSEGQSFFDFQKDITVKGKTESGINVFVNERLAMVDPDGNFSHPFHLSEGDNRILVEAIDQAKNETMKEITVKYYP